MSLGLGMVGGIVTAPIGGVQGLAVGTVVGAGIDHLMNIFGESTQGYDTNADGGSDYSTKVTWDYSRRLYTGNLFVTKAAGSNYEIFWTFREGQGDYQLKITGTVWWAQRLYHQSNNYADYYYLSIVGSTSITDYIDV